MRTSLRRGSGAPRQVVIAYLTSAYARATDTFIRDEVTQLRAAGDVVVTFSIRRPDASEVVNDQVAAERAATTYLLDLPWTVFAGALAWQVVLHPRRLGEALRTTRSLSRPGLRARLWPVFYLLEACVLARHLRRAGVDHLHDHIGEGSASVALLASQLTGIPYSFTVHGPSEWDRPHELSLDLKTRGAAFVATISEHTRGQLRRWVSHQDWDKVHVVRCGVRTSDGAEAPGTPLHGVPTLVSVGRLAHEKGHLVLLQSLTRPPLLGSRLRVVIIGDGPERKTLESYVADHHLASTVELVGWQPTEQVLRTMRAATALVMPSFAEGLPVSIMEAYLVGLPVISSDVGGVSELVEPGVCGWLVTPGSVEELTAALADLVAMGEDQRRAWGRHGRQRVLTSHSIESEVAVLRELIHRSVGTTRRGR